MRRRFKWEVAGKVFAQDDKVKYKLQSDELQLVTIIDLICTDATANIGPGFFPLAQQSIMNGLKNRELNICE